MRYEIVHLEGCTDCRLWLSNRAVPDAPEWSAQAIEDNWPSYSSDPHYGGWDVLSCCSREECEDQDGHSACESFFSWGRCEVCGSRLGGDRYHMTAMRKVYADLEMLAGVK